MHKTISDVWDQIVDDFTYLFTFLLAPIVTPFLFVAWIFVLIYHTLELVVTCLFSSVTRRHQLVALENELEKKKSIIESLELEIDDLVWERNDLRDQIKRN